MEGPARTAGPPYSGFDAGKERNGLADRAFLRNYAYGNDGIKKSPQDAFKNAENGAGD